jgi:sugar-phosphatase
VNTENPAGAEQGRASTSRAVRAVLFDLDGTLIDTEVHTDAAIAAVAACHGVNGFALPASETRGRTWAHIADSVRAQTGIDAPADALAAAMLEYWNGAVADVSPVRGAQQAVRDAVAAKLQLAVVSSSPRSVIDYFLKRLGLDGLIARRARIGGDRVTRGKPDPEGFLLAAQVLGVESGAALVFEDSHAGLLAARAAGMRSMFITCCASDIAGNAALATASCVDYASLPPRFWSDVAAGAIDLANQAY